MRNTSIILLLMLASLNGYSASIEKIPLENICTFDGQVLTISEAAAFSSSLEARKIIEDIVNKSGLAQNFVVRSASVPNASAVVSGTNRFILYNQNFISAVNRTTGSRWGGISILAHEVGHHLNGHTISPVVDPNNELDADRFSGFMLQKMGANLDQAQVAVKTMLNDAGSSTHPPKNQRLAAVAAGWAASCDERADCTTFGNDVEMQASGGEIRHGAISHIGVDTGSGGFSRMYYVTDKGSEREASDGAMELCKQENDIGCAIRRKLSGSECATVFVNTLGGFENQSGQPKVIVGSTAELMGEQLKSECADSSGQQHCKYLFLFCATPIES